MGVREEIDKHPKTVAGVALIVVAVALTVLVYSLWPTTQQAISKAYYTDDDGATWFVDTIDHVPPFDHDGKIAVRVNLYTCDESKTSFVGYLERNTPAAKKKLEAEFAAAKAQGKPITGVSFTPDIFVSGTEIKKPGKGAWMLRSNYPASYKVMDVQFPNGGTVDSVFP